MTNLTRIPQSCVKKAQEKSTNFTLSLQKCDKDKNGKAILPVKRTPIEIIKWGMSLGKTHQQQVFIKKNPDLRHVYIVPTQALAREASERLGLPCYLDFDPTDPQWFGSMVVCIASFRKVLGNIDCLYIDESESCLEQLNSKTIFSSGEAQQTYFSLIRDIQLSTKVTLMDAHAGKATQELVLHANRKNDTQVLFCEAEPISWVDMGSKNKHQTLIHQRIRKGKRLAIACSSKNEAKNLSKSLQKSFPKLNIRCYHSDNHQLERSKYKNPFVCDVLIYTNVIGSGISIDIQDHYDERHIVICENTGNARNIQQMSQRVRNPKDPSVYFSGDKRQPKETWKTTPEKLLHNWALAKEDSIRLLETLNITICRHFEHSEERKNLLKLLATIESSSIENGKEWAATWIRQNLKTSDNDEKIENEAEIKAQLQAISQQAKEERALNILVSPTLEPKKLADIENKFSKTEEEINILEKARLQKTFGEGFTNAPENEQLKIIKEDEHGKLTSRVKSFAAFELAQTKTGRRILAKKEASEITFGLENQLRHNLQRCQIQQDVLFKAAINLTTKTTIKIDRIKISDAYWWSKRQKEDFERLKLPAPPQDSQMKWLSSFLETLGIKLLSIKRPSQKEEIMTEDGLRTINTRQREYQIDISSIERMKKLSSNLQKQWREQYEVSYEESENEENEFIEIMSTAEYNYLLQKVVDTQLSSLKNAQFKDSFGFSKPTRPPLPLLSAALKPSKISIDIERWKKTTAKRKKEGKLPTEIEQWIEPKVLKKRSISYHKIISTLRCSRRYPIIQDESRTKDDGLLMLSSLPKELRDTFRPKTGYAMLDFDMKCANLSILAAVSKDEVMADWLKGDAHQATGDFLLREQELTARQRRKIGKIINNSMVAGAGVFWLKNKLAEFGIHLTYKKAEGLHNAWWNRFPKALEFRNNHKVLITEKVKNEESHALNWYGRQMFYFDAELLGGQRGLKGWPESIEKRQEKAERSAFTALLRAYESMIMDHVLIEAKRLGMDLVCPMFDGALFAVPCLGEELFEKEEISAK